MHKGYLTEISKLLVRRCSPEFGGWGAFDILSESFVSLLSALPPVLQSQAIQYAEKTEIPSELVVELAIAHFLDPDSITFDDCQVKVEKTSIAWLKQHASDKAATSTCTSLELRRSHRHTLQYLRFQYPHHHSRSFIGRMNASAVAI